MKSIVSIGFWSFCVVFVCLGPQSVRAEDVSVDLSAEGASRQWVFLDKTASIRDGELLLDGREKMSRAFFEPLQWSDVGLRAKFLVEPADHRSPVALNFHNSKTLEA